MPRIKIFNGANMNKIRIVSILTILSFLLLPIHGFATGPVLSMAVNGTITLDATNMTVGTVLKAYCGDTDTEIGETTLAAAGEYGTLNTSLPVNSCAAGTYIYVQATTPGNQVTEKKKTDFRFTAAEIRTYNIAFLTSSAQPTAPTAPSGLTATVDSQTEVTLDWVDNSSNETRFEVWKDGVELVETTANVVTYQATGLTAATAYIFKVRAANEDQYSDFTSEVSATTLAVAVSADSASGIVTGNAVDSTEAGYVNDSTTETVVRDAKADIISDINVVGDLNTGGLTSISGSSAQIVVGKQAVALGTVSTAATADADFNTNAISTIGVVETIVFVPVDTTTATAQKVAVIIPKLTLITDSDGNDLASVEIRPPVVQSTATIQNAITASFPVECADLVAPVDVKASISIPTSVSGIEFKDADGTTAKLINICMDKADFADVDDVLIYDSADGVSWAIDSDATSKEFLAASDQFCFQTNHLTYFAVVAVATKSVSCTQSGAPTNATYVAGNVNVTWGGSSWSTAANCSWGCSTGYVLTGGLCVTTGTSVGGGGGGGGGDIRAPSMSNIAVARSSESATITWTTNESSLSWVIYGASTAYGSEAKTSAYISSHSVALSGLSPETTYHYQLKSRDSTGNIGTYTDRTFTTLKEGTIEVIEVSDVPTVKLISEMTIAELKVEIVRIAGLIAALQQELLAMIGGAGQLTVNLKIGDRGEAVTLLQTWLARDIAVYPEGIVSGWFGPLTKAAAIRFQEKYHEDVLAPWKFTKGTGYVGSTTRAKLNALYGGL